MVGFCISPFGPAFPNRPDGFKPQLLAPMYLLLLLFSLSPSLSFFFFFSIAFFSLFPLLFVS
jgi:hypothetical protein